MIPEDLMIACSDAIQMVCGIGSTHRDKPLTKEEWQQFKARMDALYYSHTKQEAVA